MNAAVRLILAAAVAVCAASATHAVTIYVNWTNTPPGSGTAADPYTTVTNALSALAASNAVAQGGHTISVAAGFYSNQWNLVNGHSGGSAINTLAATGGEVVLYGQRIDIAACSNFTIRGVTVDGAPGRGIQFAGQASTFRTFFTITNATVRNCTSDGLYVSDRNCDVTVANSIFYKNVGAGVYFFRHCDRSTVDHCAIVANAGGGVRQQMQSEVVVRNSVIAGSGSYGCREEHNQGDIVPTNCLFYANGPANFFSYEYSTSGYTALDLEAADDIDSITGGQSNIVANPGFCALANNWNFNAFYADSPCLGGGVNGADIGPCQGAPTVDPSNLTFYVNAATGDDARSAALAQNPASPWASIVKAATVAAAGDTVVVAGGVYTGTVTIARGGSADPVTYRASGQVTVDGDGAEYGFHLDRVAGVTLDGFEVTGCTRGIYLASSFSNEIKNCSVHNNGSRGISLDFSARAAIADSSIYSNVSYGVRSETGAGGVTLDRCRLFGHRPSGYGFLASSSPLAMRFNNCNIYDNYRGIHGNNAGGTVLQNCVIYSNASYGFGNSVSGGKSYLTNCIIAWNGDYGIREVHNQSDIFGEYNCFYGNGAGLFYQDNHPAADVSFTNIAQLNAEAGWTNNIAADPLFVNAAAGDFRLLDTSPCINAGAANTALAVDLYGNPRLQFGAVDIGSYEMRPPEGTLIVLR